MRTKFPFYYQPDGKDCGPTCLRIIAKHYGKLISLQQIRDLSETTRSGSNLLKLSDAAEALGFKTIGVKLDFNRLKDAHLPLIVHWDKHHFIVVYKYKNGQVYLSDPAFGLISVSKSEFISRWIGKNATEYTKEGIALLLDTTPKFHESTWKDTDKKSIGFLFQYLFKYKSLLVQLSLRCPYQTKAILNNFIHNKI